MRIALITNITPASDNIRGTSALPYHLMSRRPEDITIDIFSFNFNRLSQDKISQVEKELDVTIHILPRPKWLDWVIRLHLMFIRVLLRYPILCYVKLKKKQLEEIMSSNPNGIWVYGEEMAKVAKQFHGIRRAQILPDSEAMYYHRMLGSRFVFQKTSKFWRSIIMYRKYIRLERSFDTDDITYLTVGEEDAKFLKNNNTEADARFLRHPHYNVKNPERPLSFSKPRIKLILAGQYNYYMQQTADEWIAELRKASSLADKFDFTFLGKGWERHAGSMKVAGWQVQHITFAPDYQEELMRHDIQLTPISIGTGTKGKVLDAIANGLLVIGTWYALENVAVEDGTSCICCDEAERLPRILADIAADPVCYERMALAGREAVLREHGREKVAKEFFDLFKE